MLGEETKRAVALMVPPRPPLSFAHFLGGMLGFERPVIAAPV